MMKAEIDITYNGLTLTVCGEYDTDERRFIKDVQILHAGADLNPVMDPLAEDDILELADAEYWAFLVEKNARRGED